MTAGRLAELVLAQEGQAVAAEQAGCGGGDRRRWVGWREGGALGSAGIVPLIGADAAPSRNRAELEVRANLIPQCPVEAVSDIGARLLRNANVGNRLTVRMDSDDRSQRRDTYRGR